MKLLELLEKLKDLPLDSEVEFSVDCPYGGNSLPCQFNNIWRGMDQAICIQFYPDSGVEFEVFDRDDEDEDEDEEDEDKNES